MPREEGQEFGCLIALLFTLRLPINAQEVAQIHRVHGHTSLLVQTRLGANPIEDSPLAVTRGTPVRRYLSDLASLKDDVAIAGEELTHVLLILGLETLRVELVDHPDLYAKLSPCILEWE